MARLTHQQRIEARWQRPFWDLVRDFAEQGLTKASTARALGINPTVFHRMIVRHGVDLFPHKVSIPEQYFRDTGETFKAACLRLSKTHLISEAARYVGYAKWQPFRYAMQARGIEVTFRTRQGLAKYPRSKAPARVYISQETAEQYARLRLAGARDEQAAAEVGYDSNALRRRVQRHFPQLWERILGATKDRRTRAYREYHNEQYMRTSSK